MSSRALEATPHTAEITGSRDAVTSLLAGEGSVEALLAAHGLAGHAERFPLMVAAIRAARAPTLRVWTEGLTPGATVLTDRDVALAIGEGQADERVLLPLLFDEVVLALLDCVGLRPRPRPEGPVILLPPGAMATLIGRGEARGHGLPAADANLLQERLDLSVRHWSVRLSRAGPGGGGWRRNLEVVDGPGGIWRVRALRDGPVELAPTTSTQVLRELVALLAAAHTTSDAPAATA